MDLYVILDRKKTGVKNLTLSGCPSLLDFTKFK